MAAQAEWHHVKTSDLIGKRIVRVSREWHRGTDGRRINAVYALHFDGGGFVTLTAFETEDTPQVQGTFYPREKRK
jgi:hypothetical protein